jgi:hypothetical protein
MLNYLIAQMAQATPPPTPKCGVCGAESVAVDSARRYYCAVHLEQEKARRRAVASAAWIEQAFRLTKPELRKKLYRALSTVFHPDVGGEEDSMKVLNAVYERFS